MTRLRLTPHFTIEEFDCRDGSRVPPTAEAGVRLWCEVIGEPLRREFGPVQVTSGYRDAVYNRKVGGAARSFHVYDLRRGVQVVGRRAAAGRPIEQAIAADVVPLRGRPVDWERWLRSYMKTRAWPLGPKTGAAVGYSGSWFVHVDTGPRRTWG